MKKIIILSFLLIILAGCQNSTNPANENRYETENNVYIMSLYLDDANDTLSVVGELYYKNDDYDLNDLYIIIYPNAYKLGTSQYNTTFEYLRINGSDVAFDIGGDDDTALHITLAQTLLKGQRISITYKYEFQYWDFDRIVAYDHYYLTMFFYPWVAMYDDEEWHVEPYTFHGESYYNEVGDYYVSLNVPSNYLVASGGKVVDEQNFWGRKIINFELQNARDFSFSASSLYHVYQRIINGINIKIYAVRDLTMQEIEDSFQYLEDTMNTMTTYIGPYNYDHFTLEYGYFYGMESSGVIYCLNEILEGTVVHEVVHQWFYSMIGNDQANESFLDESLTTYAVSLYYYGLYGMEGYNGYLNYRTSLKPELAQKYQDNLGATLLRQVDEYGEDYAFLIYYHGPAMLRYFVEEFLGNDVEEMAAILHTYFLEYNNEVVTLDAFLDLMERESEVAITKEWFYLQLNALQDFDNRP